MVKTCVYCQMIYGPWNRFCIVYRN